MLEIGKINRLEVYKFVDFGVYLDGEQYGPILLPKRYVPENVEVGNELDVFIYLDSEDRLIATTETPRVQVGECAYLLVKQVNDFGAFVDWGLPKDLFIPFREQKITMKEGTMQWVYVYVDKKTDRIVGSAKLDSFLDATAPPFVEGNTVDIQIHSKTDIGYKVIIEHSFWGVLYTNEIFSNIQIGETQTAYIKKIRDDNKIDVSLQKIGFKKTDDVRVQILDALTKNNGFLTLHDKSSPEEIQKILGISKKSFKMTIGILYREGRIIIEEQGIRLQ